MNFISYLHLHFQGRDLNIRAPHLAFDALEVKEDAEVMVKSLEKIWKIIYGIYFILFMLDT